MSDEQALLREILELKKYFGKRLLIPAHHYQRSEIVEVADLVGDSYKLAVDSGKSDADYIVFCGVRFMAEGASVLAQEYQRVLLPETTAVCPMAEMITYEKADRALSLIRETCDRAVVPVVYMNAHADMKAFCGEHGGAVCTSSNARKILDHYFAQGKSVFFFPDQYLGINTGIQMGLHTHEMKKMTRDFRIVPVFPDDTSTHEAARIYVWDGFCPVHQRFSLTQIEALREEYPDITIIVHPEVHSSVAATADLTGSTEQIFAAVRGGAPGTVWGIGTEYNFVHRIALEGARWNKIVIPLERNLCPNMDKTTVSSLLDTLRELKRIDLDRNLTSAREITVDHTIRKDAAAALLKMIEIVEGA